MPSLARTWALPVAFVVVANVAGTWYRLVSEHVPDPYLDEVFHVPQAQRYCKGDYSWDPKITTPPGLYLASLLLEPFVGCDTSALRMLNLGAICLVCLTAYDILRDLRSHTTATQISNRKQNDGLDYMVDAHSALNISLFPPLFFFSGLYYTDVVSTLIVLLSYNAFLKGAKGQWKARHSFIYVLLGIGALSVRQTNIFWVAVFPAGLALINVLKKNGTFIAGAASEMSPMEIVARSWSESRVYDVSVQDATAQDYILVASSVILAAMKAPLMAIKVVTPYITLAGLFTAFVVWNGGVVLGDKSNHIATIHSPQMLYFWPYVVFFSLPLVLPVCLSPVVHRFPASRLKRFLQDNFTGKSKISIPGVIPTIFFMILGILAVHFNTIVHPFTRADNRHYVFYVFRILTRNTAVKYAAVPLYYISAWMALQTLGTGFQDEAKSERGGQQKRPAAKEGVHHPCQASFILVWLATTSLSVISAPLVEPRYFIIPWIIWRLQLPSPPASSSSRRSIGTVSYNKRLALETAWHLAINAITGYIFLYRGYLWPNEPNEIQRFLY